MARRCGAVLLVSLGLWALCGCTSTRRKLSATASPEVSLPGVTIARSRERRSLNPRVSEDETGKLVAGNTQFALDLYRLTGDEPGDFVFSPHSIATAFSMVYSGARNETARQIAEAFHYDLPPERLPPAFNRLDLTLRKDSMSERGDYQNIKLRLANSLWLQRGMSLRQSFLDTLARDYDAGLQLVDFGRANQARRMINHWVAEQTEGHIRELLQAGDLSSDTSLVLANAVYFHGKWLAPFHSSGAIQAPFHRLGGGTVKVDLMSLITGLRYYGHEGLQAVELPYRGETYSMVVAMPPLKEWSDFERSIDAEKLTAILDGLAVRPVDLRLPRFELRRRIDLVPALRQLGVRDAFDPGRADLAGMTDNGGLSLAAACQEATVRVDEEGTVASAATAICAEACAAPPRSDPVTMTVDHPFLFAILHRPTRSVLFLGRVVDPRRV